MRLRARRVDCALAPMRIEARRQHGPRKVHVGLRSEWRCLQPLSVSRPPGLGGCLQLGSCVQGHLGNIFAAGVLYKCSVANPFSKTCFFLHKSGVFLHFWGCCTCSVANPFATRCCHIVPPANPFPRSGRRRDNLERCLRVG